MAKFAVIIPAAGSSSRMTGFQKKKPFLDLKGRPVWVRTAEHFLGRSDVCEVVLVVAPDDLQWFRETYRPNLAFMDIQLTGGGSCRAESVRNGLQVLRSEAEYIAVHDAARPLLTPGWIDSVFTAAVRHKAAIPGLRITSTIKRVNADGVITETVDRTGLVQA
ncbi:MAG: 2-C-methyl-D-erythritol 4-phosphate cytidylyltransferase, partial [Planctomycetota bacterium]